jgi:riboflavin kinase/FMN adenylyltransferase
MQVLRQLTDLAQLHRPLHIAIGVFDGVHLGHQRVIGQARHDAGPREAAVVITFDPHPVRVLHPAKAPPLLTSLPHKLQLIEQLGPTACVVLHFDAAFAGTTAEQFIAQLTTTAHRVRQICIGARFHFGHHRAGNARLLERLAPQHGFTATEIPAVTTPDGESISSSAVRQHVLHGRLDRAAAMLGRPFSLLGTVEPGDHRGQTLGFPTANLNPHNEVLPPDGVYAVRVLLGTQSLLGVANIGYRPTFAHATPGRLIEVHLLDFTGNVYGRDIEVVFVEKLRGEQKFSTPDALRAQITADITRARQALHSR